LDDIALSKKHATFHCDAKLKSMAKQSTVASEDFALRSLNYTKEQLEEALYQSERYVRENPGQAMLYAFVAGYILNRLPVAGLLRGLVRLSLFALKPAILLYGATKLYTTIQNSDYHDRVAAAEHSGPGEI
jgi:hypothetical protein